MKIQKFIVDTSVMVKWLVTDNELHVKKAEQLLKDATTNKIVLLSPSLSKYELGNALLKRKMGLPFAFDSITTSYKFPVTFVNETEDLALLTYRIAQEYEVTYYDASFVALAKQEKATLITDNPKHQAKIKEVKVVSLKDYK